MEESITNLPKSPVVPFDVWYAGMDKWHQATNLDDQEIELWWLEQGSTQCSFCNHYTCAQCPLKDDYTHVCNIHWSNIHIAHCQIDIGDETLRQKAKQNFFTIFKEEAVNLLAVINSLPHETENESN